MFIIEPESLENILKSLSQLTNNKKFQGFVTYLTFNLPISKAYLYIEGHKCKFNNIFLHVNSFIFLI